ncbi:MAG: ATP-binding cassette domain-containing protein, partial [Solirubrobacteraceae bacterium]
VRLAHLGQTARGAPEQLTALEAVIEIRARMRLADGRELTAGRLVERFGFSGERSRTQVRDLSGGERRRLELLRLLMGEPNVLLLDEPTNDLDIDTLRALEDLLDRWPGTLVVVSHDRYFVERVCDNVHALTPDGRIRHLPGGIDQYIREVRGAAPAAGPALPAAGTVQPAAGQTPPRPGAARRAARKELQRLERELERTQTRERELQDAMAVSASDHERLLQITEELGALGGEHERLEAAWLQAAEALEG